MSKVSMACIFPCGVLAAIALVDRGQGLERLKTEPVLVRASLMLIGLLGIEIGPKVLEQDL